ncbi:MAG: type II toxin-antitoxin system HicB family antitoxin [Dehalococcoidia bacterium]|nr:type II toxin-antitoxin system HicB family antitoxin [Dehalococcoidia bacterium]
MSGSGQAADHLEFKVNIVVEPDEGSFHAYCPALKGLHTCGDTEEEALDNAVDAARAYLQSLIKHGDPIPLGVVETHIKGKPAWPPYGKSQSSCYTKELVVAGA